MVAEAHGRRPPVFPAAVGRAGRTGLPGLTRRLCLPGLLLRPRLRALPICSRGPVAPLGPAAVAARLAGLLFRAPGRPLRPVGRAVPGLPVPPRLLLAAVMRAGARAPAARSRLPRVADGRDRFEPRPPRPRARACAAQLPRHCRCARADGGRHCGTGRRCCCRAPRIDRRPAGLRARNDRRGASCCRRRCPARSALRRSR